MHSPGQRAAKGGIRKRNSSTIPTDQKANQSRLIVKRHAVTGARCGCMIVGDKSGIRRRD